MCYIDFRFYIQINKLYLDVKAMSFKLNLVALLIILKEEEEVYLPLILPHYVDNH